MTTLHTRPIPQQATSVAHEHAWITDSRHRTSEGVIAYVRCSGCSMRRVDLQQDPQLPPVAVSRVSGRPIDEP